MRTAESFQPYLTELKYFAKGVMAMWSDISHHDDCDWWYSVTVNGRMFDVNLHCDPDERVYRASAYFVGEDGQTITSNYHRLLTHTPGAPQ